MTTEGFFILYYLIVSLVQIVNNITTYIFIIPIGLLVHLPFVFLGRLQASILYILLGGLFDAMFPFLPFGFSMVFLLVFFCFQKAILPEGYRVIDAYRIGLEHAASALYIFCIFAFSRENSSISQFLVTLGSSQIFLLAISKSISNWLQKAILL